MSELNLGRYTGRLILEPLPDGRRMRVLEDFGFLEEDGLHWPVPPRSTVDGASIPQALWSLIGGPFEGKYRDASVVHDYYCDVRSADWKSVHRMFYRAMLVSGVSVRRAKVMYTGVYFGGPRWNETVVENVRLGPPAIPARASENSRLYYIKHDPTTLAVSEAIERDGMSAFEWVASGRQDHVDSEVVLQLERLSDLVGRDDPSLRTLEAAIDESLTWVSYADESPRQVSVGRLGDLDWPA